MEKLQFNSCLNNNSIVLYHGSDDDIIGASQQGSEHYNLLMAETKPHLKLPTFTMNVQQAARKIDVEDLLTITSGGGVGNEAPGELKEDPQVEKSRTSADSNILIPTLRESWQRNVTKFSSYEIRPASDEWCIFLCNHSFIYMYNLYNENLLCKISHKGYDVKDLVCVNKVIFVAAAGKQQCGEIHKYIATNGEYLGWFPVGFSPDSPHICIKGAGNMVYLASSKDGKVFKFPTKSGPDGVAKVETFLSKHNCKELADPRYMAVNERLVVVGPGDTGHKILVFNHAAELQFVYGSDIAGLEVGQLHSPSSLLFDSKGNIFIVDQGNKRVYVVTEQGKLTGHVAFTESEFTMCKTPCFINDGTFTILWKREQSRNTEIFVTVKVYDYRFYLKM